MARILVVEDELNIAHGLKDDLELEGYEVDISIDGNDALAKAQVEEYDLILLDRMLPGREGLEICRELRRAGNSIPIIILSAKTQEQEKAIGLDSGADDYVSKPYSPIELRARIRASLRRHRQPGSQIISFEDFELDLARMKLIKDGQVVRLTPIEFKLLSVLAANAGRPLSRTEIIDQVWGSQEYVADRTVDAHITYLRKKIEPEPANPRIIVSVRGVGYRFDG